MKPYRRFIVLAALALMLQAVACPRTQAVEPGSVTELGQGWALAPSSSLDETGDALSKPGYNGRGWHEIGAPGTVLAGLLAAGVYDDIFFGDNLRKLPGSLPPPLDVSASRMPLGSPFRKSWWYRVEFDAPPLPENGRLWLHLDGVNYAANVWLNGRRVASSDRIRGTYRVHRIDVTDTVGQKDKNALAIEVIPPGHRDLAITWVDWNPAPPDRNMGLWRGVRLEATGPVNISNLYVDTDLELPSMKEARLTVVVDAANGTDKKITGKFKGAIDGGPLFEKEFALGPGEVRELVVTPDDEASLVLKDPEIWWPWHYGGQPLYGIDVEFVVDGKTSDRLGGRFGVREVSGELEEGGAKTIRVNGKRVLIRGAGWAPDMLFRTDPARLDAEVRYARDMNLNAIRLEGKHEVDRFYDLCDELGILVVSGWCCCHHWERWKKWDDDDRMVASESQRDQLKRVRNHPSMVLWMNGSDKPPPEAVERDYLEVLRECRWPAAAVSSATEAPAELSGPSGVKMNGPYEYVPPVYWYEDKKHGGAWNFNTETSPGPAVPPIESLRRFIPEDELWPAGDAWNYHAGRNQFGNIEIYKKAQDHRYGASYSAEEFSVKSQAMSYELQRAMMEAFGREKYKATGVIQWMLNDAWPSIIWHLYDYYLLPGGGYFGTKKACEQVHAQYSYDDRSVVVVNSGLAELRGLKIEAALYDIESKKAWSKTAEVSVGPDGVARAFDVPEPEGISKTYFLDLALRDGEGNLISDNFYWLSTRPDTMNWLGTQWFYTPAKTHADYRLLNDLPEVELHAEKEVRTSEDGVSVTARVKNDSDSLAFMVRLKLADGRGGGELLPVIWSDNYFCLLPGEEATVEAFTIAGAPATEYPVLEIGGWNVKPARR